MKYGDMSISKPLNNYHKLKIKKISNKSVQSSPDCTVGTCFAGTTCAALHSQEQKQPDYSRIDAVRIGSGKRIGRGQRLTQRLGLMRVRRRQGDSEDRADLESTMEEQSGADDR